MTQRELREIESEKKRRVREMKLRRYLQERLPQETPRDSPIEKKKKYRYYTYLVIRQEFTFPKFPQICT